MSMILDALKRSREGQDSGAGVPSVDTQHYVKPDKGSYVSGTSLFVLAATGALIVALVVFVVVQWRSKPTDMPTAAESDSQAELTEAPSAKRKNLEPGEALESPGFQVNSADGRANPQEQSRIAALYRDANSSPAVATPGKTPDGQDDAVSDAAPVATSRQGAAVIGRDDKPPSPPSGVASNGSPDADVPAVNSGGSTTTGRRVTGQAEGDVLDIAELVRRTQSTLGKPALTPHDAPLLDELSQQQKDAIPTIMYTVHDWSSDGVSRITLNGQVMVAGQQKGGVTVTEILSDSAILSWRGTRFRLRALNSWVNL